MSSGSKSLKKPHVPVKPLHLTVKYSAINKNTTPINRFKHKFEMLFDTHDKNEGYQVTNNMIEPYLTNLDITEKKSNPTNYQKKYTMWLDILKNYRHLMYLDQYISLYNYCNTNISNTGVCKIDKFINANSSKLTTTRNASATGATGATGADSGTSLYFHLPILELINNTINAKQIPLIKTEIVRNYSEHVYEQINNIMSSNKLSIASMSNINDILVIASHGGVGYPLELIKVPDNVVIAFPTPLNKLSYDRLNIFKILHQFIDDPNFYRNPACYFRGNTCLKHTVYFYPGQYIPNYILSYNTDIEWEKTELGIYNRVGQIDNILFTNTEKNTYETTLKFLFNTKLSYLENKIIYFSCCRPCDFNIPNNETEFLYRYEHITTYMNISNCINFKGNITKGCGADLFYKYDSSGTFAKTANNTKNKWFFDSALSYTFNPNNIKKLTYLSSNDSKWLATINKVNKLTTKKQIEYINHITLMLLNQLTDDTAELYSDRIIELLDVVKYKSNLYYAGKDKSSAKDDDSYLYMWISNYDILTKIYNVFKAYDIPFGKFRRIYNILLSLADEEENGLLHDKLTAKYYALTE